MHHDNAVIKARCEAVNRANAYAAEIWPKLEAIFKPYVGQKVCKVDGSLLAKIKKEVDALELSKPKDINVYRYPSGYSINYVVTADTYHNNRSYRHEHTIYVANIRDGILESIYEKDPQADPTVFTVDHVIRVREAFKVARDAFSEAQSALYPFGEYDR